MKKMIFTICCLLALALSLTACNQPGIAGKPAEEKVALAESGTILLRVNPQIAVSYNSQGIVTDITAKNDDAAALLTDYQRFADKQAHTVVAELVSVIGEAGYFVEEIEGESRRIILEIEPGSVIPSEDFVDTVVREVQRIVRENEWHAPLNLEGVSDYGATDYGTTDYGTTDYGTTDYGTTDYGTTDYGTTDYGATDYGTTDYGTTDYGTTDYGTTDYGATDYGTTDYGTTDYGATDYGATDYGTTDYGATDYGNTNYGDSAYDAPPSPTEAAPASSYGQGDSGYSDYAEDSGYSDYSDYGVS